MGTHHGLLDLKNLADVAMLLASVAFVAMLTLGVLF